jgi:hypothetical protein
MITNTQYLVLKRIRSGSRPLCGHDMVFNLAHKELITVGLNLHFVLTNKGHAAVDEYEAGL